MKIMNKIAIALVLLFLAAPSFSAQKLFLIIVNKDLQSLIQTSLDTYVKDLKAEGYAPEIVPWTLTGSTPEDLRAYLKTRVAEGLVGEILIGDIPYAQADYGGFTGPCDVFYMDLTSNFVDSDANGGYDQPYSAAATLMCGRIRASNITMYTGKKEEDLINLYFTKNHKFRTGQNTFARRAFNASAMYVDHNGAIQDSPDTQVTQYAFNNWTQATVKPVGWDYATKLPLPDPAKTLTHARLMSELNSGMTILFINAHGCASFCETDGGGGFSRDDMVGNNFQNAFYYFYSCDMGNYRDDDCCGFISVFQQSGGLATIAYTATTYSGQDNGEIVFFKKAASSDTTIGEAIAYGCNGFTGLEWQHICIFGDPTLKLYQPVPPPTPSIIRGDGKNSVYWGAVSDPDLYGFNVYRSYIPGGPYTKIAGLGNTGQYTDTGLTNGVPFYYIAKTVLGVQIHQPASTPPPMAYIEGMGSAEVAGAGTASLDFIKTYPNPANIADPSVKKFKIIGYTCTVKLSVFTLDGQKVREVDGDTPGLVEWDFKNTDGKLVAAGMYVFVLETPDGITKTGKIAVTKQ